MARITFAVNKLTDTYERGPKGGGAPTDASNVRHTFQNVGGVADIGTQGTTVATNGTTIVNDIGSAIAQCGSVITAIGAGAGSAQAAALLTILNTASTDAAANQTAANAIKSAGTADVQISVNTANVTRVQQLKAAFDNCISLALGGWGGMTK